MTENCSTRAQLSFSILALFSLILVTYANTLTSPFNFDDQALLQQVVLNDPDGFNQIWPIRYRHLLYFSFSFNHSLSGLSTFSYHLTNLLFHFLTSTTILLIIYKTLSKNTQLKNKSALGISTTTTLLFALNPLHAEAITYISGRASGVAGFFYLLALLFFILGSERNSSPRTAYYFLSLLVVGIAILSKENTLPFPLGVILFDLCVMKKKGWEIFRNRLLLIYFPVSILVEVFIDVSGGSLYLLALLFIAMGSIDNKYLKTTLPLYYFLAPMAFCLALLSKETTFTLPFVIILYDLCFMRNEGWHPFKNRLLFLYTPLTILVSSFIIFSPPIRNLVINWFGRIDINYALAQAEVLAFALKICFFPINLTFDYDLSTQLGPLGVFRFLPIIIWLAIVLIVIKNFRRISPIAVFCFLWFLITISPTNSFLPRVDLLSERNLYLPSIGPTFLIAYIFYHLFSLKLKSPLSNLGLALLAIFLIFHSSLLITRNSVYRTNIRLWEDTYKKSPADLKVLHNLSHFYLEDKRYQQAMVTLLKLSRSNAGDFYRSFAHSNLGSIFTQNGNFGRAEKEFHKAIALEPSLPLGHLNLGSYYASRGKFQEARTEFLLAHEQYSKFNWGYPMPVELDLNLARVNWQLKSFSDAEKYAHQYLKNMPDASDGLLLLGKVYQEEDKFELAKESYKKIRGGGLASAKAQNNLGILYLKKNQLEKAQLAFNSSIASFPQIPDAHYNLGKLILDLNGNQALAQNHLELALRYNNSPSFKEAINLLLEQALLP
jgi:Flp pilus assembly protein TadD